MGGVTTGAEGTDDAGGSTGYGRLGRTRTDPQPRSATLEGKTMTVNEGTIARIYATDPRKAAEYVIAAMVSYADAGHVGASRAMAERYADLAGIHLPVPADEDESTMRQTACKRCGHDVEGDTADDEGEWRDRGGGTTCLTYEDRNGNTGFVRPPNGQLHEPMPDA
jgi:hypothetical protein